MHLPYRADAFYKKEKKKSNKRKKVKKYIYIIYIILYILYIIVLLRVLVRARFCSQKVYKKYVQNS